MKILLLGENALIKLTYFYRTIYSNFSFISSIHARQLAAITPKKHTVKVLVSNEEINYDEDCDGVFIHFRTGTAIQAYKVADCFRNEGKMVILSGGHPSALPEEAGGHADSVLVGNVENLWFTVLDDLENDSLKSVYRSKAEKFDVSFGASKIDAGSNIPMVGVIEASRGCPYKCDFCQDSNVLHGSVFRPRPIDEIINEIKTFPQKFLFFCDASLTIDPSFTKDLFRAMKGLKKKFVCEGNADVLARDDELCRLSHEAGCTEWTVGFESFFQQTLEDVHKKTNTASDFDSVVKNVHKHKMAILGTFMFGFEHDTNEVFNVTLNKIKQIKLDSARFAILTPYPGTPMFNKLKEEGRILTKDWSKYNRKTVVFKPKKMTPDELQTGFFKITSSFNSLPNVIYRDVRCLKRGFFPFINCVSRNLENYLNRPKKWVKTV
ncbi:MAG: B12-binding domain-containing radical SAM protein [Thermoplasmatales archaeon]|nr:MAG: B12-binding domain-containing radical SAM protein [Thermoplasmatales archaeon]